ncbi:MAG: hypothetical protein IT379_24440 [Deltaproteobacteria bacterium]|nr:hypothetical protein [Deltaproteobacteria bacterium]
MSRWAPRVAIFLLLSTVTSLTSEGRADADAGRDVDAGQEAAADGSDGGAESDDGGDDDAAAEDGDGGAAAAEEGGGETPTTPAPVYIGLYLLNVDSLDLKAGTAEVTYYVWTRWRGAVDGSTFELVNGAVEAKEHEYRAEENGEKYAYWRCRATVQVRVDFHEFPFESHELMLAFEHSDLDIEGVVWRVDRGGIKHLAAPVVSGWVADRPVYEVTRTTYKTNWGYPGADPDDATVYSRFNVRMRLSHAPIPTFVKTLLPLFISVLIAFLAFFIEPGEIEARVGLGVAGTFGVVTNQAVVAGNLPEVSYMTLSDKIHLAGLVCVFLALLGTCYTGWLTKQDKSELALRIDHGLGILLGGTSVMTVVLLVAYR